MSAKDIRDKKLLIITSTYKEIYFLFKFLFFNYVYKSINLHI